MSEKKSKYTEEAALKSLIRQKGVRIDDRYPDMLDISKAYGLGNGSWGKLDFLTKKCGFQLFGMFDYSRQF